MPWHKNCTSNQIILIIAIFLILGIASFFRFWQLDETPPGLYHDEAMNVNQAREAWREGDFNIFYPENNGREGLFINIQALSLAAFGATPFAARLPSAVFGILTVLGVFFLTKELFLQIPNTQYPIANENENDKNSKIGNWKLEIGNYKVALFASFFLATSFWHILFSRIGFRAIMAPFFLVWSMYFLWKIINRQRIDYVIASDSEAIPRGNNGIASLAMPPRNDALRSTLYAAIGGLLFGLGFHSYIAYRMAPLLLIVPFFVGWQIYKSSSFSSRYIGISIFRMRSNCLPCLFALFLFFAFVAALPLGIYFLEHPADFTGRSTQVSIFSSETPLYDLGKNILVTLGMFFWHGDYNWRHNFAGSPQLWWPVSILFLIGIVVSCNRLIQNAKVKTQNDNPKLKSFKFLGGLLRFAFCVLSSTYGFLLLWFLVFLLPVILSNEGLPHALRALPLAIPAMIFAARGLEWIMDKIDQWLERQKEKNSAALLQLIRIKKELLLLFFAFLAAVGLYGFGHYFLRWAPEPYVYIAFNGFHVDLGRYLADLPSATKKYVIVNTPGHILADNIPMPAQTVMFFTDTWSRQKRDEKNFVYIPSADDLSLIPQTLSFPTTIAMLRNSSRLRNELKNRYPELTSKITNGGLILTNIK